MQTEHHPILSQPPGQTVSIDRDGVLGRAEGRADPHSGTLTILNNRGSPITIALKSRINNEWKTVYVSPDEVGNHDIVTLKPVNKVKIWFQQHIGTSQMISDARVRLRGS